MMRMKTHYDGNVSSNGQHILILCKRRGAKTKMITRW
jgi:hypothetical protein